MRAPAAAPGFCSTEATNPEVPGFRGSKHQNCLRPFRAKAASGFLAVSRPETWSEYSARGSRSYPRTEPYPNKAGVLKVEVLKVEFLRLKQLFEPCGKNDPGFPALKRWET